MVWGLEFELVPILGINRAARRPIPTATEVTTMENLQAAEGILPPKRRQARTWTSAVVIHDVHDRVNAQERFHWYARFLVQRIEA